MAILILLAFKYILNYLVFVLHFSAIVLFSFLYNYEIIDDRILIYPI